MLGLSSWNLEGQSIAFAMIRFWVYRINFKAVNKAVILHTLGVQVQVLLFSVHRTCVLGEKGGVNPAAFLKNPCKQ